MFATCLLNSHRFRSCKGGISIRLLMGSSVVSVGEISMQHQMTAGKLAKKPEGLLYAQFVPSSVIARALGCPRNLPLRPFPRRNLVYVVALSDEQASYELCECRRQAPTESVCPHDGVLETVKCPRIVPGPVPRRLEEGEVMGAEQLDEQGVLA